MTAPFVQVVDLSIKNTCFIKLMIISTIIVVELPVISSTKITYRLGWQLSSGGSSVVEHLPRMHEVLGSISNTKQTNEPFNFLPVLWLFQTFFSVSLDLFPPVEFFKNKQRNSRKIKHNISCTLVGPQSPHGTEGDLGSLVFLPLPPPTCWNYRCALPHLVLRDAGDWIQTFVYSLSPAQCLLDSDALLPWAVSDSQQPKKPSTVIQTCNSKAGRSEVLSHLSHIVDLRPAYMRHLLKKKKKKKEKRPFSHPSHLVSKSLISENMDFAPSWQSHILNNL